MRIQRLDKLVLSSFVGPFILTYVVVVFILFSTQILRYMDDLFGKGLGLDVLGQFIFHFAIFQTPVATPLAVMLASLMTFGNLGEHSELTAIKGAGISLTRAMKPIFFVVLIVTAGCFYTNNYEVPKSTLKAYSLLYDIKQKKPTLDIKENVFYSGIDKFRIKVSERDQDGKSLKGLIIYDHTKGQGNTDVILADSGLMYTINNDRYLKLELYNGNFYSEEASNNQYDEKVKPFNRTEFEASEIIFDLSSFDLKRTKEELFKSNRLMRNLTQLNNDTDSLKRKLYVTKAKFFDDNKKWLPYHSLRNEIVIPEEALTYKQLQDSLNALSGDSLNLEPEGDYETSYEPPADVKEKDSILYIDLKSREYTQEEIDSVVAKIDEIVKSDKEKMNEVYRTAVGRARQIKSKTSVEANREKTYQGDYFVFNIQRHRMISLSFACITFFLIGAPLGAIIKKGGIGLPVLISIVFFIIFYVISMAAEKNAKQGLVDSAFGMWISNIVLLPVGFFFLNKARKDARLFDLDYYYVMIDKIRTLFGKKNKPNED